MCIRDRAEGCQPVNFALPSSGSKVRPLWGDCEPVGVRFQGRSLLVGHLRKHILTHNRFVGGNYDARIRLHHTAHIIESFMGFGGIVENIFGV